MIVANTIVATAKSTKRIRSKRRRNVVRDGVMIDEEAEECSNSLPIDCTVGGRCCCHSAEDDEMVTAAKATKQDPTHDPAAPKATTMQSKVTTRTIAKSSFTVGNRMRSNIRPRTVLSYMLLCISLLSLLSPSFLRVVEAFPNGAGGCEGGGNAAVGGKHVSVDDEQPLSFADVGMEVIIGGNAYPPGSQVPLLASINYTIFLSTKTSTKFNNNETIPFKGFLIRLESNDSPNDTIAAALSIRDEATSQYATACQDPGVLGVTHTDNAKKSSVAVGLRMDYGTLALLDITLVYLLNDTTSIYSYGNYSLQFVGIATDAPSSDAGGSDVPSDVGTTMVPSAPMGMAPSSDKPSDLSILTGVPSFVGQGSSSPSSVPKPQPQISDAPTTRLTTPTTPTTVRPSDASSTITPTGPPTTIPGGSDVPSTTSPGTQRPSTIQIASFQPTMNNVSSIPTAITGTESPQQVPPPPTNRRRVEGEVIIRLFSVSEKMPPTLKVEVYNKVLTSFFNQLLSNATVVVEPIYEAFAFTQNQTVIKDGSNNMTEALFPLDTFVMVKGFVDSASSLQTISSDDLAYLVNTNQVLFLSILVFQQQQFLENSTATDVDIDPTYFDTVTMVEGRSPFDTNNSDPPSDRTTFRPSAMGGTTIPSPTPSDGATGRPSGGLTTLTFLPSDGTTDGVNSDAPTSQQTRRRVEGQVIIRLNSVATKMGNETKQYYGQVLTLFFGEIFLTDQASEPVYDIFAYQLNQKLILDDDGSNTTTDAAFPQLYSLDTTIFVKGFVEETSALQTLNADLVLLVNANAMVYLDALKRNASGALTEEPLYFETVTSVEARDPNVTSSMPPSDLRTFPPSLSPQQSDPPTRRFSSDVPATIRPSTINTEPLSDRPTPTIVIPTLPPSDIVTNRPTSTVTTITTPPPSDIVTNRPTSLPSDVNTIPPTTAMNAPSDVPSTRSPSMVSIVPGTTPTPSILGGGETVFPSFAYPVTTPPSEIFLPPLASIKPSTMSPTTVTQAPSMTVPIGINSDMPIPFIPTLVPVVMNTVPPSDRRSEEPSDAPSDVPSDAPSDRPSDVPSSMPSNMPSPSVSILPGGTPVPTTAGTASPTFPLPTSILTLLPGGTPSPSNFLAPTMLVVSPTPTGMPVTESPTMKGTTLFPTPFLGIKTPAPTFPGGASTGPTTLVPTSFPSVFDTPEPSMKYEITIEPTMNYRTETPTVITEPPVPNSTKRPIRDISTKEPSSLKPRRSPSSTRPLEKRPQRSPRRSSKPEPPSDRSRPRPLNSIQGKGKGKGKGGRPDSSNRSPIPRRPKPDSSDKSPRPRPRHDPSSKPKPPPSSRSNHGKGKGKGKGKGNGKGEDRPRSSNSKTDHSKGKGKMGSMKAKSKGGHHSKMKSGKMKSGMSRRKLLRSVENIQ